MLILVTISVWRGKKPGCQLLWYFIGSNLDRMIFFLMFMSYVIQHDEILMFILLIFSSRGSTPKASLSFGGVVGELPKLRYRSVESWENSQSIPNVRWSHGRTPKASLTFGGVVGVLPKHP